MHTRSNPALARLVPPGAHFKAILSKFGVHSRLEAVSYAIANGIIEPPT